MEGFIMWSKSVYTLTPYEATKESSKQSTAQPTQEKPSKKESK